MNKKSIVDTGVKIIKYVGAAVITLVCVENGYHGGKMLIDDVEYTTEVINGKLNPKATTKRTLFGKPEEVNLRTGKWVSDKTDVDPKKLEKLRKNISK